MDDRPDIPDQERGLYAKYLALKVPETLGINLSEWEEVTVPFFLLKFEDPHARRALLVYALSCQIQYPKLAEDIRRKLHEIEPLRQADYSRAEQDKKTLELKDMFDKVQQDRLDARETLEQPGKGSEGERRKS